MVCTGNIIRSAALGILLQHRRPDLEVESAGVGVNAKNGLTMRKRMRGLMHQAGYGIQADAHRSRRWDSLRGTADLAVGVAPVHMKRLAEIAPGVKAIMTPEPIFDPIFGADESYLLAWEMITEAADWLASEIPDAGQERG